MYGLRKAQPVSERFFNQERLKSAIIRLWRRAVGHNHLAGVSHVVGTRRIVGMRIVNIVAGLGFVGGQSRGCGRWRLGGQGRRLLHMLRRPEVA